MCAIAHVVCRREGENRRAERAAPTRTIARARGERRRSADRSQRITGSTDRIARAHVGRAIPARYGPRRLIPLALADPDTRPRRASCCRSIHERPRRDLQAASARLAGRGTCRPLRRAPGITARALSRTRGAPSPARFRWWRARCRPPPRWTSRSTCFTCCAPPLTTTFTSAPRQRQAERSGRAAPLPPRARTRRRRPQLHRRRVAAGRLRPRRPAPQVRPS